MAEASHNLKHDSAGFLIGDQPVSPTRSELSILQRLRDDLKAFRGLFSAKKHPSDEPGNDAPSGARSAGTASVTPATPRLSGGVQAKPQAMPELGKIATPVRNTAPAITVNVTQPVATPQRVTPEKPVMDRALPKLDANGKPVPVPKPVKPELNRPAKQADGVAAAGTTPDAPANKIGKLLGDIRDKISAPDLSGSEDVDPNVKAAQEIAGVAGGALNGIKAVGGVLGTVATPMLNGAMGMIKPKANDAPTPWFKRFFNELRGLRREESVFNRAQLRTLKEIEAKPGEGKGGGIMGMLMMLIGPLIAAIGAAITAGFGLLMKLPGMGLLAKLATKLVPAVLLPKRPITQPTTVPGAGTPAKTPPGKATLDPKTGLPVPDAGAKPVDATKKPTLWERTKTKVSGWMGKGKAEPVPATPVQEIQGPPKPPGRLAKAAGAVKRMAKVLPVLGRLMTLFSVTSSVAASEGDDNLSRGEKDKRAGSAIGGGVGGVVGGALGVMVAGPLGAIVGSFVGDKVGAIVGEEVGGWVTELRNADIPGMINRAWTNTTDTMGRGWDSALKTFGGIWDKAKGVFDDLSLGVTNLLAKFGIDLPDIKKKAADKLAAAEQKAKDVAGAVGGAVGAAVDYGKEKAGQVGDALKNSTAGKGASWVLDQFKGDKRRAAETAQAYSAGNIAGLDDAQTRALVASTVLTESSGGKLDIVNPQGYMGRYQAGASWLSSAGLMKGGDKAVKDAMKADGFNNEWKWAESGGMTRYLSKDANWVDGMSRSKYLASAGAQDTAFKTVNDKTYGDLVKRGVIKPGDKPEDVAGYLKTAHIAGAGGAVAVSKGGQGASDANGTSARKYFDDVAKDRYGFNQAFKNAGQAPVTATPVAPAIPAVPASTTVVTAGARNIPKMPSLTVEPPKVPDFQPVTAGLATTMGMGEEKRPSVIVVGNKTPVGRDLSNRPLAHIVTGGLSGS